MPSGYADRRAASRGGTIGPPMTAKRIPFTTTLRAEQDYGRQTIEGTVDARATRAVERDDITFDDESVLARLESGDPGIADAAWRDLRDAALQAAREAALHTELGDLDVTARAGVVRVRDGVDEWFCWEAAWDRTWEAAVSGAIDIDYSIFCGAIDGNLSWCARAHLRGPAAPELQDVGRYPR
jgi:hypothetical protein